MGTILKYKGHETVVSLRMSDETHGVLLDPEGNEMQSFVTFIF